MSFSTYPFFITRDTVRNKLKNKDFVTREFKGRSSVWASFLVVTTTEGVPVNYVICKECEEVFTYRGHSSGTSTLRKHVAKCIEKKAEKMLLLPDELEHALKATHILLQGTHGHLQNTPARDAYIIGEDRKYDFAALTGGAFAPGLNENSTESGEGQGQGHGDDVPMPLSPEQFLSEEMEQGASPTTPLSQRPESYKLRHNNHLTLVLESLAGDESFMDVTLTAQGKAIKAHKSVLSAVSPYFRSVLKENPCQHPIIIMPRDIRFDELNNIISYVYKGEMTVAADDLSSLLKTAEILQVTGLSPSETSGGTGGIMSQMQGIPSNVFANSSSSKSSAKRAKQGHQQPPQAQHQQESQQASGEEDKQTTFHIESQGRIDPLEFLNADMTCVKEEITSDTEETEELGFAQASNASMSAPPAPNPSSSEIPNHHTPNSRKSLGGSPPRPPQDDPCSKPFNPGEHSPPTEGPSSSSSSSSPPPPTVAYVCPHCLETHRPTDALHAHLRLKHPSKPSFICACGRVFLRQMLLAEHAKKCKI